MHQVILIELVDINRNKNASIFLKKFIIPSEAEDTSIQICESYKENNHLKVYELIKTVDIIHKETHAFSYSNRFPVIPSNID